jgi:hypothetical protein
MVLLEVVGMAGICGLAATEATGRAELEEGRLKRRENGCVHELSPSY